MPCKINGFRNFEFLIVIKYIKSADKISAVYTQKNFICTFVFSNKL